MGPADVPLRADVGKPRPHPVKLQGQIYAKLLHPQFLHIAILDLDLREQFPVDPDVRVGHPDGQLLGNRVVHHPHIRHLHRRQLAHQHLQGHPQQHQEAGPALLPGRRFHPGLQRGRPQHLHPCPLRGGRPARGFLRGCYWLRHRPLDRGSHRIVNGDPGASPVLLRHRLRNLHGHHVRQHSVRYHDRRLHRAEGAGSGERR